MVVGGGDKQKNNSELKVLQLQTKTCTTFYYHAEQDIPAVEEAKAKLQSFLVVLFVSRAP